MAKIYGEGMIMKQIFEIAAAILTSIGGGTVILFGLSNWLGKVWANRILEKEKSELAKEFEDYKTKMDVEVDRISKIRDKELYISKVQYDYEYKVYQEIWASMNDLVNNVVSLYPLNANQEKLKECIESAENSSKWDIAKDLREDYKRVAEEIYNKFSVAYQVFDNKIENNSPFYNNCFYVDFCEIRNLCNEVGSYYKFIELVAYNDSQIQHEYENEGKMTLEINKKIGDTINKINEKVQKTMHKIRKYLLELQIRE